MMTARTVIAGAALLGLSACTSIDTPLDDGYQVGDITATALELQAKYCATADPYRRAVILALLHRFDVPIPERGACTDILALVDTDTLPEVDVEAAEEDQERYGG